MGDCKVLGPIRAFDAEGRPRALVSAPQRRLLALLCLHAGSVVRSAVLQEHLGLTPGALRTSIARLRRTVGDDMLVTGSAGYELRAEVDSVTYERHVTRAFESRPSAAMEILERADAMWTGPPYAEFANEQWAEVEVRRLEELHAAALEELAVILLDRGDDSRATVVLIPLVAEHPYRDRPLGLLMRALSHAGRTTEALRQFRTYRSRLSKEVGTAPSRALIELDRAIASGTGLVGLEAADRFSWTRRELSGSAPGS